MCVVDVRREPVREWLRFVAEENNDEYLRALLAGGRLHQVGHISDEPDKALQSHAVWTTMGQLDELETKLETASHQLDDGCSYFNVFSNIRERIDFPLTVSLTFDTLSTSMDTAGALRSSVIGIEERRGNNAFTFLSQPRFGSQTVPALLLDTVCEEKDVYVSHSIISMVDENGFGVFRLAV